MYDVYSNKKICAYYFVYFWQWIKLDCQMWWSVTWNPYHLIFIIYMGGPRQMSSAIVFEIQVKISYAYYLHNCFLLCRVSCVKSILQDARHLYSSCYSLDKHYVLSVKKYSYTYLLRYPSFSSFKALIACSFFSTVTFRSKTSFSESVTFFWLWCIISPAVFNLKEW